MAALVGLVEASKEVPKGSEEVLIEIDGKFELVSAADMQAKQPADPPTPRLEVNSTNDQNAIKNGHMKLGKGQESSEGENYDDDDFEDDVSHSTNSIDPKEAEQSNNSPEPPVSPLSTEPPIDPVSTKPPVDSVSAESSVDSVSGKPPVITEPPVITKPVSTEPPDLSESKNFPMEKHNKIPHVDSDTQSTHSVCIQDQSKADNVCKTDSTSSVAKESVIEKPKASISSLRSSAESNPHVKPQDSSVESEHDTPWAVTDSTHTTKSTTRTISAPSRSTVISQHWEEGETERRQRCENAFKAWLSKKDAQITEERRLQRANTRMITKQEKLENIERCQTAYRAWLENKNTQIRERRHHQRNVKSASTKEPQECAVAFRQWLEQKQIQRRKEREVQIRRQKEEAELAQRVDPSIANQAYRRWLRKKNIEAREEAARRLELQKYYFRQGRLIKESLKDRFQGF